MLDTNIRIYLLKNRQPAIAERVNALGDEESLCMSFVTYADLLKGAERSSRKRAVLSRLEELTRVVPVDNRASDALCRHSAEQFTRLKNAGTQIGANDLWIASHELAEQATLVTNNTRVFERIDGLTVEDWTN